MGSQMGRLEGKVAIVTGGASGIGEATVRLFLDEGARVVVADIQDDLGKSLAEELGEGVLYQHCDVSQADDVKGAIDVAAETFGPLDVLFNNAGLGGPGGPIEDTSMDEYDAAMSVLLRGVFLGMKFAAPVMKAQGTGSIINTSSVAALQAGFGPHTYAAAKAAVKHLTRSVAMELSESGIRVNCICPGGIATPLLANAVGAAADAAGGDQSPDEAQIMELIKAGLANTQPTKRAGLPEDIAQAALWLASDEASFVTGQAIVVDGGLSGGRRWGQSVASRQT